MTRARRHQRGMALLIVLGFVALFSVIATMMITTSKTALIQAKILVERSEAKYVAESAISHAAWMLIADRRRFRNRTLGQPQVEREMMDGTDEAWMADGTPHLLDFNEGPLAEVKILDANRGWDVSSVNPSRHLRGKPHFRVVDDEERAELLQGLFDKLDDYVDADDLVRAYGMERDHYEALGFPGLPRNRPFLFREETYWIEGIAEAVPSLGTTSYATALPEDVIRLLPPKGVRFPSKISFFSSSPEMIAANTDLNQDELELVLEARKRWYTDNASLQDSLADLYPRVAAAMSLAESGIVTIEARAGSAGSDVTRRLVVTMDLRRLRVSGLPPYYLPLWQKVTH